ncbi:DUF6786 family protein [Flagellimonas onchidii]|uniref:DUF6786 family protein n=1 Tax=Flagellimonas onchidii TaxID=2562684 RepID=UPI0010A63A2D|nr:DUF6786 family protein [Allomuricauda onchidii]
MSNTEVFQKGTFGYDALFIKKHFPNTFILSKGNNQVLITPELQGRVMSSTLNGSNGSSFGWINYDYIESGERSDQFNPFGGEDYFWVGPEGGQFSVFFKPGASFDFSNWKVPSAIDTEPFNLVRKTNTEAHFQKEAQFTNHSNNTLRLKIDRTIRLLDKTKSAELLGITMPKNIQAVGFESENVITNTGTSEWTKESGMPSIWILSMLKSKDNIVVTIPFKTGKEDNLGKIVTDDYFGKVPANRLKVSDSVLYFKADGKKRSKIGLSPKRALPIMGSFNPDDKILTIAQFTIEENQFDYVNSLWKIQEHPFEGDAINSYNDGPLENGEQLGPFYELESSSRAADLGPTETLMHYHRTFHFTGDEQQLKKITPCLLG